MSTLRNKKVIVFGCGGVGGYVIEALVRSNIGEISIVDYDVIDITNINRQIIATRSAVGQYKVDVFAKRIKDINPDIKLNIYKECFKKENQEMFHIEEYDYVIDAIDMVKSKLDLISLAKEKNTPIISALGAGNKLDPTRLEVSDISKTEMDPLAKVIRVELRKRGINHLKVVYSKEVPLKVESEEKAVGSTAWVPSTMGLIIASEVIKDLIK